MSQVASHLESTSVPDRCVEFPPVTFDTANSVPTTNGTSVMSGGTGVVHFNDVRRWISEKPLRIRGMKRDPVAEAQVFQLADRWIRERPRGVDVHEQFEHPAYKDIIRMGLRAVGPLLSLVANQPDHWFYALHRITYANPVPSGDEGNLKLMAEAWIAWGRVRGYIRDMD